MARPKTPDGRRVAVSFKLTETEAELVDSLRGGTERSVWLREAAMVVAHAKRDSGIPKPYRDPYADRRPRPARLTQGTDTDPTEDAGDCPHPKARVLKGLCNACGTYVGS